MLIAGFPLSTKLPEDLGLGERFWYWRGASGRRYIHSIYTADACPPLPGAVYVAVRRTDNGRRALAVGRFDTVLSGRRDALASTPLSPIEADEIHVHLLARNDDDAEAVLDDLAAALADRPSPVAPHYAGAVAPARLQALPA